MDKNDIRVGSRVRLRYPYDSDVNAQNWIGFVTEKSDKDSWCVNWGEEHRPSTEHFSNLHWVEDIDRVEAVLRTKLDAVIAAGGRINDGSAFGVNRDGGFAYKDNNVDLIGAVVFGNEDRNFTPILGLAAGILGIDLSAVRALELGGWPTRQGDVEVATYRYNLYYALGKKLQAEYAAMTPASEPGADHGSCSLNEDCSEPEDELTRLAKAHADAVLAHETALAAWNKAAEAANQAEGKEQEAHEAVLKAQNVIVDAVKAIRDEARRRLQGAS